ncbi:hypothetical protein MNBD_ALPHA06-961 [hydrothermal vent metagenome]|uniref:Uncharacterized protein n=1 Tax=hydrothermal vent metagenome TaxID=652676 RepID=A0A3B0R6I0_9ZZZZ
MSIASAIVLLFATLATAFLSGIFGMAGGLILMGILLSLLPVAQAMVVHGILQMIANGWRSYLLRNFIVWKILLQYILGAVLAIIILWLVAWRPDRVLVFVLLGLVPFLVWLPRSIFHLDATKPAHAVLAGLLVTSLNTFAGVAGPMLDVFFVRTGLSRQQIVATKSISQVIAHVTKVVFWSGIAFAGALQNNKDLLVLLLIAIPFSISGTWLGGLVLHRLSDKTFLRWVKILITLIGTVYLLRAVWMLIYG